MGITNGDAVRLGARGGDEMARRTCGGEWLASSKARRCSTRRGLLFALLGAHGGAVGAWASPMAMLCAWERAVAPIWRGFTVLGRIEADAHSLLLSLLSYSLFLLSLLSFSLSSVLSHLSVTSPLWQAHGVLKPHIRRIVEQFENHHGILSGTGVPI